MTVKTVGLDLAKDVFQVHCVSAAGRRIINKKIKRAKLLAFFETLPRCIVDIEACGRRITGVEAVSKFAHEYRTKDHLEMPEIAGGILGIMCHQLNGLNARIDGLTKLIEQHAWLDPGARRLMRMPGIGAITASAIVAAIGDAKQFKTGRDLAAWLGLTPLNKSSAGKERFGRITKKGDRYIRKLLIVGMTSRALMAKNKPEKADIWTAKLLAEKPFRLATVAMANKSARTIWAILTKQEEYQQPII